MFVFAGECVVLVLQFLHGGSEARQFGLQSLVVAAGAVELDRQLVNATLHVACRALGVLQPLRHVARVRVRLHNDQPRAPTVGRSVGWGLTASLSCSKTRLDALVAVGKGCKPLLQQNPLVLSWGTG